MAGVSTSSSPARTVPACKVPVTTVPLPLMANTRSSHSRTPPRGSGSGSRAASRPSAATRSGRPWPVSALTATASIRAETGVCDLERGLPQRGRRIGQVGPGDHQDPVADAEGVDRREMLGRLRHPALVGGHHEHHRRCRARAGEHIGYESLVPGHVDERDLLAGRQRHPREAEVDGHAPALLRLPPIRLHPGERAHQHRLPVIHMTGGRDDVHCYSRPGEEAPSGSRLRRDCRAGHRDGEHSRGEPLVVGGRDGAQVEQQPAALDPADDRRHVAAAHRRARPQVRRQPLGKGQRGARQRHAGAAAAADRGLGRHRPAVDARAGQPLGLRLGALPDRRQGGRQCLR